MQSLDSLLAPPPEPAPQSPCCGPEMPPTPPGDPLAQPFVLGRLETPAGPAPLVSSSLGRADAWGAIKARWGWGRMRYLVQPGLYALGQPGPGSPVLATANYKLSFDRLRGALPGRSAWILVLDTRGVNVWCAAGKGTFGTRELVDRIQAARLDQVVAHRQVILPQLGGPGVAAFEIKKQTGFKAIWGPVMARDLPAFLDAGLKATPAMRRKDFPLRERLALVPMELVDAVKPALGLALVFMLAAALLGPGPWLAAALRFGLPLCLSLLAGMLAGAVLTPLLLPWLPGRAFSVKGAWAGLGVGLALGALMATRLGAGLVEAFAWLLLDVSLAAFLAMNFTGASTYTSLSGVKLEMRRAVPLEILGAAGGLVLWVWNLLGG